MTLKFTPVFSVILLGGALATSPVQGQTHQSINVDHDRYSPQWHERGGSRTLSLQIQRLDRRVAALGRRDDVAKGIASDLDRDVIQLERRYRDYALGGLDTREVSILRTEIRALRDRIDDLQRSDVTRLF